MDEATGQEIITPGPGVYYDIPFEVYLKWDAFSKSCVPSILRSPAHYQEYKKNPPDTAALRLGSLVDLMLFEPENVEKEFEKAPEFYLNKGVQKPWNYNANYCNDWRDERINDGITIVTYDQWEDAKLMKDAILNHRLAAEWIKEGEHQVSIIWEDDITGEKCKARLDNLRIGEGIDDLKTTENASPTKFSKHINDFMYHVQGAVYSDGWAKASKDIPLHFNIIAAEKTPPYAVATYTLGIDSLILGRHLWRKALDEYHDCKMADSWPAYSQYAEEIDVPGWELSKLATIPEEDLNG